MYASGCGCAPARTLGAVQEEDPGHGLLGFVVSGLIVGAVWGLFR